MIGLIGLERSGAGTQDIESTCATSVRRCRSGEGPFVFAGWSFGGSMVWLYAQGTDQTADSLRMVEGDGKRG
jgi:thioesterase domain-containing protein